MLDLLGVEALPVVLLHASVAVHLLDEADHGLVTLRVKVNVVSGSNSRETSGPILNRVLTNIVLDVVPEICDEALSVVELNAHGLIVDGTPRAVNYFSALAVILGLALLSLSLVPIKKHRTVDLFLWECEFVLRSDDLDLIRKLMGAKLIRLKQIYGVDLGVNVEVPRAEHVVLETVDGLVRAHRVKRVQIVKEASNCQGCFELTHFLLHYFR